MEPLEYKILFQHPDHYEGQWIELASTPDANYAKILFHHNIENYKPYTTPGRYRLVEIKTLQEAFS